jgi:mannitol/fructose-specific phosphotransferase system IIA component (Ntr-type)
LKLSSLIESNLVITSLKARDAEGVLEEFADLIEAHRKDGMRDTFLAALKKREEQASTALEMGVAVPHARLPELDDFILAAGASKEGIDFGARDGMPSRLFFVILAPPSKNTVLLHCLAAIAKLTIDDKRRNALISVRDAAEFTSIIEESGVELKKYLSCSDIMERSFDTVAPDMTVRDVLDLFAAKGLEGAPVISKENILLGELTGKDLISLGLPVYMENFQDVGFIPDFEPFEEFFRKEKELKVADVFSREVFSVEEKDSVLRAAFFMVTKNRRRVYVTSDDGRLTGIVNRFDLISKVLFV